MSAQTQLDEAFQAVAAEVNTKVSSDGSIREMQRKTRAEFDAIQPKDPQVLYVVID